MSKRKRLFEVVALLVMGPLALRQLIRLLSNPSILLPLDSAAFWGAGRLDLTGCNPPTRLARPCLLRSLQEPRPVPSLCSRSGIRRGHCPWLRPWV